MVAKGAIAGEDTPMRVPRRSAEKTEEQIVGGGGHRQYEPKASKDVAHMGHTGTGSSGATKKAAQNPASTRAINTRVRKRRQ